MKVLYLAIISAVAIGFVGTSYALVTHNEPVNIFGDLNVVDGNMVAQRSDGNDIGNGLKNTGGANIFQFFDVDDNQVYRFTLAADGSEFSMIDFTHANRKDMVVKTDTGNIGFGQANPQEKIDVNGNIKLNGNILSNGDICIGACP